MTWFKHALLALVLLFVGSAVIAGVVDGIRGVPAKPASVEVVESPSPSPTATPTPSPKPSPKPSVKPSPSPEPTYLPEAPPLTEVPNVNAPNVRKPKVCYRKWWC